MIYPLRSTNLLPNMILKEIQAKGQNIRDAYQRRLPSDTSKDYYFMQRDTGNTQTLTVEYGFLDSTGDDVKQLKTNYKEYAEAVVKAVVDYIKGDYIPVGKNTYVVQKGDSLWSIAKKYNITVNELKQANNLTLNLLSIGQILTIPQQNIMEFNTYTVEKGDSLYSIARKYYITVNELKQANNLISDNLSIGQVLIIPFGEPDEDIIPNYIEYVVQKGDTLYGLANKYNTTVDNIKSYNNLTTNALSIGQRLKIPKTGNKTYTVEKGDSLYSIARKYNTTVASLKEKNNLTSNLLSIGQLLII